MKFSRLEEGLKSGLVRRGVWIVLESCVARELHVFCW